MDNDEVIYSRFLKERNEEDLRILLVRHKDPLLFFLYGYVHNMEDAEELMMDSFAEVAAGRTLFSGRSSFKTWLFAVARNKARMHLRRHRPVMVSIEEVTGVLPAVGMPGNAGGGFDAEDCDPEAGFLKNERDLRLHDVMKKLSPDAQHVLHLIYFADMSYDEVARVLGKSRRQTYHLADRCRSQLKKILESEGYHEDDR